MMGLLDYIKANTPRNTRKPVSVSKVINEGLLNPNQYNAPAANRLKDSAFGLLGLVPGAGDVAAGAEAADLWNRGEKLGAGLSALGTLPLIPAIGAHVVYHGSPHKFTKFDMSKIGTGEGAQAYGHGLYFAESPDVARSYQASTTRGFGLPDGKNIQGVANAIAMRGEDTARKMYADLGEQLEPTINAAKEAINANSNFYKVDIPDEAIPRMLDWDKPLSEQAPEVLGALQTAYPRQFEQATQIGMNTGDFIQHMSGRGPASGEISENFRRTLNDAGIPGIRYLDGTSRTAGDGTSNFVLFDDELARILEINGQPTGLLPWAEEAARKKK